MMQLSSIFQTHSVSTMKFDSATLSNSSCNFIRPSKYPSSTYNDSPKKYNHLSCWQLMNDIGLRWIPKTSSPFQITSPSLSYSPSKTKSFSPIPFPLHHFLHYFRSLCTFTNRECTLKHIFQLIFWHDGRQFQGN